MDLIGLGHYAHRNDILEHYLKTYRILVFGCFLLSLMLMFTKLLCLTTNYFLSNHWPTNAAHTARSIDEEVLMQAKTP